VFESQYHFRGGFPQQFSKIVGFGLGSVFVPAAQAGATTEAIFRCPTRTCAVSATP